LAWANADPAIVAKATRTNTGTRYRNRFMASLLGWAAGSTWTHWMRPRAKRPLTAFPKLRLFRFQVGHRRQSRARDGSDARPCCLTIPVWSLDRVAPFRKPIGRRTSIPDRQNRKNSKMARKGGRCPCNEPSLPEQPYCAKRASPTDEAQYPAP
jgi:hypothetical protein